MKKTIITNLPQVYTVDLLYFNDQLFFGIGSEGHYPLYIINIENRNKKIRISDGPGGVMSMVVIPGESKRIVSVMGLYPPFIGDNAAIYLHEENNSDWNTKKLFNLPFAHRCQILTVDNVNWLFAASVSVFKNNPEDWSLPGEVYIVSIDNQGNINEKPTLFIDNVTRNHGMSKENLLGKEAIYISGKEGIFEITPGNSSVWDLKQLFDREVSEFIFFDINNDGLIELITIEPFHGDTLNIYEKRGQEWISVYRSGLIFGHGLSAGIFKGRPSVVVGNRRGDKALNLFYLARSTEEKIKKEVIEEGVAPTQTKIFTYKALDYILSSNQAKGEVALYH